MITIVISIRFLPNRLSSETKMLNTRSIFEEFLKEYYSNNVEKTTATRYEESTQIRTFICVCMRERLSMQTSKGAKKYAT